jgi:hypothetical protein
MRECDGLLFKDFGSSCLKFLLDRDGKDGVRIQLSKNEFVQILELQDEDHLSKCLQRMAHFPKMLNGKITERQYGRANIYNRIKEGIQDDGWGLGEKIAAILLLVYAWEYRPLGENSFYDVVRTTFYYDKENTRSAFDNCRMSSHENLNYIFPQIHRQLGNKGCSGVANWDGLENIQRVNREAYVFWFKYIAPVRRQDLEFLMSAFQSFKQNEDKQAMKSINQNLCRMSASFREYFNAFSDAPMIIKSQVLSAESRIKEHYTLQMQSLGGQGGGGAGMRGSKKKLQVSITLKKMRPYEFSSFFSIYKRDEINDGPLQFRDVSVNFEMGNFYSTPKKIPYGLWQPYQVENEEFHFKWEPEQVMFLKNDGDRWELLRRGDVFKIDDNLYAFRLTNYNAIEIKNYEGPKESIKLKVDGKDCFCQIIKDSYFKTDDGKQFLNDNGLLIEKGSSRVKGGLGIGKERHPAWEFQIIHSIENDEIFAESTRAIEAPSLVMNGIPNCFITQTQTDDGLNWVTKFEIDRVTKFDGQERKLIIGGNDSHRRYSIHLTMNLGGGPVSHALIENKDLKDPLTILSMFGKRTWVKQQLKDLPMVNLNHTIENWAYGRGAVQHQISGFFELGREQGKPIFKVNEKALVCVQTNDLNGFRYRTLGSWSPPFRREFEKVLEKNDVKWCEVSENQRCTIVGFDQWSFFVKKNVENLTCFEKVCKSLAIVIRDKAEWPNLEIKKKNRLSPTLCLYPIVEAPNKSGLSLKKQKNDEGPSDFFLIKESGQVLSKFRWPSEDYENARWEVIRPYLPNIVKWDPRALCLKLSTVKLGADLKWCWIGRKDLVETSQPQYRLLPLHFLRFVSENMVWNNQRHLGHSIADGERVHIPGNIENVEVFRFLNASLIDSDNSNQAKEITDLVDKLLNGVDYESV